MLKKIECCSGKQGEATKEERALVVSSLRHKYPLNILLGIAKLARSTYYFCIKKKDSDLKNKNIMNEIMSIYQDNKGRYGYRRITLDLKNKGIQINHKKVLRLMNKLGIHSIIRKKRKYSSYKGTIGKIADNLIKRDFEAEKPNEKWFTDVTEFNLRGEKLYLSPILDAYGRYIVSYNISKSPNLEQIYSMLDKSFKSNISLDNLILHSDQGWQYQHNSFQNLLKGKNIIQSMSRKGNSIDNGLMECFFGILKSEMFYGQEDSYKSVEELASAIDEYIDYYNNKRIKVKLKGLTPSIYRNQSLYNVS